MNEPDIKKSESLPKYGTVERKILFNIICKSEKYKEIGLPFFTEDELKELENKYKIGISWEDISKELKKKGMILKKATFRRYIQDENLSSAISYKKIKKGREALYPADTIWHINFIQAYYKIFDKKEIREFLNQCISAMEEGFKAYDVIKYYCYQDDPLNRVWYYIKGVSFPDEPDMSEIIEEAFADEPKFKDEILAELDNFVDKFLMDYEKWIDKLKIRDATLKQSFLLKNRS